MQVPEKRTERHMLGSDLCGMRRWVLVAGSDSWWVTSSQPAAEATDKERGRDETNVEARGCVLGLFMAKPVWRQSHGKAEILPSCLPSSPSTGTAVVQV